MVINEVFREIRSFMSGKSRQSVVKEIEFQVAGVLACRQALGEILS